GFRLGALREIARIVDAAEERTSGVDPGQPDLARAVRLALAAAGAQLVTGDNGDVRAAVEDEAFRRAKEGLPVRDHELVEVRPHAVDTAKECELRELHHHGEDVFLVFGRPPDEWVLVV